MAPDRRKEAGSKGSGASAEGRPTGVGSADLASSGAVPLAPKGKSSAPPLTSGSDGETLGLRAMARPSFQVEELENSCRGPGSAGPPALPGCRLQGIPALAV